MINTEKTAGGGITMMHNNGNKTAKISPKNNKQQQHGN